MSDRTPVRITWRVRIEMLLNRDARRFVRACNGVGA